MQKKQDKSIHYNENAEKFAESGKVDPAAEKAKRALDDEKQARELREAEKRGKQRPSRQI
jgi:hypothetical protein